MTEAGSSSPLFGSPKAAIRSQRFLADNSRSKNYHAFNETLYLICYNWSETLPNKYHLWTPLHYATVTTKKKGWKLQKQEMTEAGSSSPLFGSPKAAKRRTRLPQRPQRRVPLLSALLPSLASSLQSTLENHYEQSTSYSEIIYYVPNMLMNKNWKVSNAKY